MLLKDKKRKVHTLDAPLFVVLDSGNFMVQRSKSESYSDTIPINFASTHTILKDPVFLSPLAYVDCG